MLKTYKTVALTFVVGAIGAIALVSAPACSSGGFNCSAASKCSADPAPTQASIDSCNKVTAGACGSQAIAMGNCALAQQVCAADGTTDATATNNNVQANCSTQAAAFFSCCSNNQSACQ